MKPRIVIKKNFFGRYLEMKIAGHVFALETVPTIDLARRQKKFLEAAITLNPVRHMDRKLIAARQQYEIYYIAETFKIPLKVIGESMSRVGRSRHRVYADLRKKGYKVITDSKMGRKQ